MTGNGKDQTQERLSLRSRLSDVAQVPGWIKGLAARHSISGNIQFAMSLCLEEALSNIIRHGYAGAEDGSIFVSFAIPGDSYFVLLVEDGARSFNPLEFSELPALNPSDPIRVGGQGIRLLRRFSDKIEYERTPSGNRLRLFFSTVVPAV